jgi:hypothetical protein
VAQSVLTLENSARHPRQLGRSDIAEMIRSMRLRLPDHQRDAYPPPVL